MIPESSADGTILVRIEDKVGILQVHRPERKNAMTADMYQAYTDRLKDLSASDDVKAVVITGSEDAFMTGVDVGKVTATVGEMTPAEWEQVRDLFQEAFATLYDMPKPTVAAVNGAAVVSGMEVALSCDIRLASNDARFRVGFRNMALMPTPAICFLLPHVVGPGSAKRMAFTNRFYSAEEALALGLVEEVVPREKLMDRAIELASELADGPALMIAATKRAMNQALGLDFEILRRQVDGTQFILTRSSDYEEAMTAFKEKRSPRFEGR